MSTPLEKADSWDRLAWAGWMMPLADGWRMLSQDGSWQKGQLRAGTSERVFLEIAWNVVVRRRFDVEALCTRHLKRLIRGQKLTFSPREVESMSHPDFSAVRIVEKERLIFIIGWHARSKRIFQLVYQRQSQRRDRRFLDEQFREFIDQPQDQPHVWQFLGTRWIIPAGYEMEFAVLNLGDIRLGFSFARKWARKGLLQCRQVYPADFALEKQSHEKWTEYFYTKMASQYFIPKKGWLRRGLQYSEFRYNHFVGIACKARLHPFLRYLFRPFVFRNPGELWTLSVVHEPANRLVQLHFGGDRVLADDILSNLLDTLRWHHWSGDVPSKEDCIQDEKQ